MTKLSKVVVKKSMIHGKGLFASCAIKKGEVIGYIESKNTKTDGPYVLWIDGVNPVAVLNEFKYINHSSKPNCAYYNDGSVIALKTIKRHCELTHKYSEDEEMVF